MEAQNNRCCFCHTDLVLEDGLPNSAVTQKIVAERLGGTESLANLVVACAECAELRGVMAIEKFYEARQECLRDPACADMTKQELKLYIDPRDRCVPKERWHAYQRLWERYRCRLRAAEFDLLVEEVKSGEAIMIEPDLYAVHIGKRIAFAVCNKWTIITFLPPTRALKTRYAVLHDMKNFFTEKRTNEASFVQQDSSGAE